MNAISSENESNMDKIRVLDPIISAGLPTIKMAIELKTKANPGAKVSFLYAMEKAFELKLSAVNLRTESPHGQNIPTGFHRESLGVPGHQMDLLYEKFQEFNKRGLRVALMESSTIDHWNAVAGIVERFGRLTLAGEVNLTPGLTHRDALTSGKADSSMIKNIETDWFGSDRARLYRILKDAGQIGVFYEVICVDNPKRTLFYDIAKDATSSHKDTFRGLYSDNTM